MREVAILGVGRTPWGKFPEKNFVDLGVDATTTALKDAGIEWNDLQGIAASESFWYGKAGLYSGQYLSNAMGDQAIPIINVNNACACGAVSMSIAHMMIASGRCDIALAMGTDKSPEGFYPALEGEDHADVESIRWRAIGAANPIHWSLEMRRRMEDYGDTEVHLAKIKVKNSKHSVNNPYCRYRKAFTLEEVMNSPMVSYPLRLYEICATSDGAAAVILASLDVVKRHTTKPIIVAAATGCSRKYGDPTCTIQSSIAGKLNTTTPILSESYYGARLAYEQAGIGPEDVDFAEIPDNSAWHELAYTECLGFCKEGEAARMLDEGETDLGGKIPLNVSGGSSSFGEATPGQGLLLVCEAVLQLRGEAGARQVEGAKVGLGQVYGAKGNSGTTILKT